MSSYSLSYQDNVTLVTLHKIPNQIKVISEVFALVSQKKINVDMISQTAPYMETVSISFSIEESAVSHIIEILSLLKEKAPELKTDIVSNLSKEVIQGEEMNTASGIAAKVFLALNELDTDLISITTSETEISFLVDESKANAVLEKLESEF